MNLTLRLRLILIWTLAVMYGITAWLGLQLAVAPGFATAVFPASGIALGFVLYFGPGVLPGVLLGSAAHNLIRHSESADWFQWSHVWFSVWIGLAATLQAYLAYVLVRTRVRIPNDLADHRDTAWLLLLGGMLACLTAPTLAVAFLMAVDVMPAASAPISWFTWYVGDALGIAVFAPLTLLWIQANSKLEYQRLFKVLIPVAILFAIMLIVYLTASEIEQQRLNLRAGAQGIVNLVSWNMLVIAMALCGMLEVFLLSVTGRHAQVQEAVMHATDQLQRANDQLETALQIQNRFLAAMSHEVRTPLNSIVGYADLLARMDLGGEANLRVQKILQGGQDLTRLVNDILNASKTDASAYELIDRPFSLAALLVSVKDAVRGEAENKGLELRWPAPSSDIDVWLLGDELRVRQILLNLLANAIKYTAHGYVGLSTRVRKEDAHLELQFLVQDSGSGIAASDLPRLFAPFSQLELASPNVEAPRQGVGLGLSISKNLALRMGGDIQVTSEWGYGSTFRLVLRLPRAMPQPNAQPATPIRPSTALRVLVVEDDLMIQELVGTILREAGHAATIVGDGMSAIDAAQTHIFDVILMDMRMPHMSGLDATRQLRGLPTCAAVRIVALTANAFSDDRAACLAAGMDDFLAKPFTADELLSVLVASR